MGDIQRRIDTGVGGGTKAESDKPAYVIGPRRLGVLMAVAHKRVYRIPRRFSPAKSEGCPSLADGVFRFRFGVYRIRGPVIGHRDDGLFLLPSGIRPWPVFPPHRAVIKKAFKKSSTRLKPFNGKRLRRVFRA